MSQATTTDASTDAWRFDLASGTVPVTSLLGTQPAPKRGETGDFEVHLASDSRGDHVERYERLVAYADPAGEYTLHDYGENQYGYTELHNGAAPGGSLLVGVRPADWDTTGRAVWGLLDTVKDDTENPQARAMATLSIVYLAPLALEDTDPGYRDRSAVSAALEADPL